MNICMPVTRPHLNNQPLLFLCKHLFLYNQDMESDQGQRPGFPAAGISLLSSEDCHTNSITVFLSPDSDDRKDGYQVTSPLEID